MDFIINPDWAYIVLVAGVVLAFFSASAPGTGVGEVVSIFCLVLAGYAAYVLSINWWALIFLLGGIVPFVMAVRKPNQSLIYLSVCIVLLIIGSVFLFPGEDSVIGVSPAVAIFISILMAMIMWYVLRQFVELTSRRPTHDLDALVGEIGTATSAVHKEGSVYVHGEMWSAKSNVKISSGSQVRVVSREGFVLVVEQDKSS